MLTTKTPHENYVYMKTHIYDWNPVKHLYL